MKLFILLSAVVTMMFTNGFIFEDAPKHFIVAKAGSLKMNPKAQAKLENAFKAVYGDKIGFEMLKLEKIDGQIWLAVYGNKGTVAAPLKMVEGQSVLDFGGPLGIVNCTTTSSCSCCKVSSCACSKKNGGQEDCGSSSCDKKEVESSDVMAIESMLF
jgi:hypothetical protein